VALFIPYVIQRPGADLIGQLLVGLVQLPFSPSGLLSLVLNVIYGVLCEVPFALTRYKLYSLPLLCGIGAIVGGIGLALGYVPNAFHLLAPAVQVGLWALVLGVCVGGGWLAKALADSLVRTGVLSGTALASRIAEEQ
jgi:energy-coupling factor transport system substrate-specific component